MSFKDVNNLRKEGKISEAYEMALADLNNANPDDIWTVRAMSWVLVALLKQNASFENRNDFLKYLQEFSDLKISEDEELVYTNLGYWVVKFIYSVVKQKELNNSVLDSFVAIIKTINYSIPSELHSKLLAAITKQSDNWHGFLDFVQWWNLDNLTVDDYKEEEFEGRKMMALAEKVYISYAKKMLAVNYQDDTFIQKLEILTEQYPKYIYPQYYLGKLLLSTGDKEQAFKKFIPFAKKKQNDFWVWELLSDTQQDINIKISCFCKALSCKSPKKMLVKVHERLARLLIETKQYIYAKKEIQEVLEIRKNEGWKINDEILFWLEQDWYKNGKEIKNNFKFYKDNSKISEELLFLDIEPEIAVVSYINHEKSILNFIVSKEKTGFFKYSQFFNEIKVGDFIKIRLLRQKGEDEFFYKVLTAEKTDSLPNENIYKTFNSELKVIENKGFAFVDGIFIPPYFVAENSLSKRNNENVEGKAIMNYDKKREKWEWKILTIK